MSIFIQQIEEARNSLIETSVKLKNESIRCNSSEIHITDAKSADYFEILANFNGIKTLFYEDSMQNINQYLRKIYYDYASNDCRLLRAMSNEDIDSGERIYGAHCQEDFTKTWNGHNLVVHELGGDSLSNFQQKNGSRVILTYIHVIADAVSLSEGDVFYGNMKIIPRRCKRHVSRSCSEIPTHLPVYQEVFTLSQYLGGAFYHSTLETLPRFAPYRMFLQKHPQILIHLKTNIKYFNILGIDKSRFVMDPVLHANLLYMPSFGTCGVSPVFTTQLLANMLIPSSRRPLSVKRDTIVLIKRSKKRWFANHDSILKMIQFHASKLKMRVQVFGDDPLPAIGKTIEMFSKALVVISPHGAGEANLIFSQPGTLLIEGLCYNKHNKVNMAYRNMAQALGLQYYGLIFKYQCMNITAEQIEAPLVLYLAKIFAHNKIP